MTSEIFKIQASSLAKFVQAFANARFSDTVKRLGTSGKTLKDGMEIDTKYVKRFEIKKPS